MRQPIALILLALGFLLGVRQAAQAQVTGQMAMFPKYNMWDSAWTLALSNWTTIQIYLNARRSQGFDTVLVGVNDGTWNYPLGNGAPPFLATLTCPTHVSYDITQPNEAGWAYIDQIIDYARSLGMYVAFLPVGNSSTGSYGCALQNPTAAYNYGRWVGARYKNGPLNPLGSKLLWILGGDVDATDPNVIALTNQVAQGIVDAGALQPQSFHPGWDSSSVSFCSAAWLTFNGIQRNDTPTDLAADVSDDLTDACPAKPTGAMEMGYEDVTGTCTGCWTATQIYEGALLSMQAGASYVAYGQWPMYDGSNPSLTPGIQAIMDAKACYLGDIIRCH